MGSINLAPRTNCAIRSPVGRSTFVLVHPDASAIPDDGGLLQHLNHRLVVHRDPSASIPDLLSPDTVGVLFAAQLDSELPLQICEIVTQGKETSSCPLFFWGPGGSPPHLNAIFNAGASDCFSESVGLGEITVRMAHRLRTFSSNQEAPPESPDLVTAFNQRVRTLAHDLKNPLCVLYGYAQMAQMGHPIERDEADDMVESSREIRERIDAALGAMPVAPAPEIVEKKEALSA